MRGAIDVAFNLELPVLKIKIYNLFDITCCSETMKRRKRKGKTNRQALVLVFIAAISLIILVAALYQVLESKPNPSSEPKPPSAEYFEISDVAYDGFLSQNDTELDLYMLGFNLTAFGGRANNVIVHNLGTYTPDDPTWEPFKELGDMSQGDPKPVLLNNERGVKISLTDEGFPYRVRITSEETSKIPQEQFITIYL